MNPEALTPTEVEVTLQEKLAEIDEANAIFEKQIKVGEAIKRLESNEDYNLVITEGYLEAEAQRLTGLMVGDDPLRRESMENIIEACLSIRNFKQHIRYKKLDAVQAVKNIEENEQFRKHVTENYGEDGYLLETTEG